MKMSVIALALSFSLLSFGQDCVDLSGTYQMEIQSDCSAKSYKSITNDPLDLSPGSGNQIHLADSAIYPATANFDLTKPVEFKIKQVGCKSLSISYERDYRSGPRTTDFKYKIEEKNLTPQGFKFKQASVNFGGGLEGLGWFGVFRYKNSFKIEQDLQNTNLIHLKSKDTYFGALFFLIPLTDVNAHLNCRMHRVGN
jgi:hypothetical protein